MSQRHRATLEDDARIFIPTQKSRRGESRRERVVRACRWCWSRGIYPSPAAIGLRLRGRTARTLNGFETTIRNGFLRARGIPRPRIDHRF